MRHIPILIVMYLATLVIAVASGLSLSFFVKRVWLFIPIFTGIVVLPATFSFITPGDIVVPFGTWFGHPVGMTSQGLTSAGLIVHACRRVDLARRAADGHDAVEPTARARCAHCAFPACSSSCSAMAYRYVFLLLNSVTDMYTARKARTVDADTDVDVRTGVRRRVGRRAVREVARARRRGAHGHALARVHR